ncbi:MAG: tRNA uridine-5-carboxymethylaminomethyl(34) synthesis GTPase MnmE [Bacillota bacterium]|nr:tRNA uridine-5-carboxymethylaminomethyl(34) synthesis GTPase MnmE [Bacillota bacterium]
MNKLMERTIAAISTAYGESGIGIVRMSGPSAVLIAEKVFEKKLENRRMILGKVTDENGNVIDEVLGVLMQGPHSYTGEDVVELQCHGGLLATKSILELLLRNGAVMAERGEFTKRAFLNGRMDLSQAEAVIDLIKARSDKSYGSAISQMEGALSDAIKGVRKNLMDLLVDLTVNMDYPDEDIEQITYKKIEDSLSQIADKLCKLKDSAGEGRIVREGLSVAIVGKPNVGKSSLLNAFLRENRSIVTSVPGTTRDTVEEQAQVRGFTIHFIDTAGIHQSEDEVESIGIERSKAALSKADLLLVVLDGSQKLEDEDKEILDQSEDIPRIIILNKTDLGKKISEKDFGQDKEIKGIEVSIKNGIGLDKIEDAIESYISGGKVRREEDLLLTNVRHINLVEQALKEVQQAQLMVSQKEAIDFIEVNAKAAFDYLGEIIGETATDQVINEVFARFCLGK